MGRYNNKRTQAAAQAAKNTPSRARFSKGPPNQRTKGGNRGGRKEEPPPKTKSRGIGGSTTSAPKKRGRGKGNPQITARVIDRIQNRVASTTTASATKSATCIAGSSSTDVVLKNVDKSKLDVVAVSKETQTLIADLLRELGVVDAVDTGNAERSDRRNVQSKHTDMNPAASEFVPGGMKVVEAVSSDEDPEDEENSFSDSSLIDYDEGIEDEDFLVEQSDARNAFAMIIEDEYNDDYDNQNDANQIRRAVEASRLRRQEQKKQASPKEEEIESNDGSFDAGQTGFNDQSIEQSSDDGTKEQDDLALQSDHTYIHLTQNLSFPHHQAAKACRAIECWDTNFHEKPKGSNGPKDIEEDDNRLELAMDWLCLHLAEADLNKGFRPNPDASKARSKVKTSNVLQLKPVAHPSISVISKPIAEQAKEWAEAVALQERILKFLRLGFHRADATDCFERIDAIAENKPTKTEEPSHSNTTSRRSIVTDDPALPLLLSQLQDDPPNPQIASEEDDHSLVLQEAKEEREQELEALEAIYDDRLKVLHRDVDKVPERYILQIHPATPLGEPAKADECFLHVFLRKNYPVTETPLLLLETRPTLPPSLSRMILTELGQQARNILSGGGCPVVFEIVSYLEENLPALHKRFCNDQRRKEFEAQQARLLKQRQIEMEQSVQAMELYYESKDATAVGRRQRAKLKAAEKAYDRPDQQKALYEEYRRKQSERIKTAQQQNQSANVRAFHAQQAIQKRQQQLIEDQAEQASRKAMNKAFVQGKSSDEARAAGEKAKAEAYLEHGIVLECNDFEQDDGRENTGMNVSSSSGHKETSDLENNISRAKVSASQPTEASSKFMERLRNSAPKVSKSKDEPDCLPPSDTTKGPTANTSAFMDRLREMYEKAARMKTEEDSRTTASTKPISTLDGYHLEGGRSSNEGTDRAPPCPVAVPTGDLVEVMTDILAQQEDQPWLISAEARAPTTGIIPGDQKRKLSNAQTKREKEISETLRKELCRKRRLADEWATCHKNDMNAGSQNAEKKKIRKSFTPQRFHEMMASRQRLPAFQLGQQLVETIDTNQITVIAGATGCGKTTQVPQLVLDDLILRGFGAETNMIVTQPRRISAIGVSERIAQERCEKVGETCGYSIKLEKKMSSKTRLLLCTTGVLLRRLQCDPDLASVSHIFVDEVHERDLNTDFLIIILKDLLARRKNLKLILMSATLNAESFSTYFGGCPVVSIPGRAHPVQEYRLEDILELTRHEIEEDGDYAVKKAPDKPPKMSKTALRRLYHPKYSKETIHSLSIVDENIINYELLSDLLEHISINQGEGAILVFCPGFQEIQKTIEEMYKKEYFQGPNCVIYPLHSSLSTDEQVAIFEVPPPGVRKIVVSTNIAETSITIEDVVFVVDTGRVKENRRDEVNETPTLEECWVSRASAKQRRGRAGRVRPGIAYHMYSSHTHDNAMLEYQLPEMLRVGIEDLVLQILILDLGEPTAFLKKALDPPSNLALANSLRLLEELGAVDCQWKNQKKVTFSSTKEKEEENLEVSSELTALGFHLASLPVDPRVGKMMIYGALFGCVDPLLTFAAAMSARSPFLSPFDQRDQADEARKTFSVAGSDHLTILNAFNQWSDLRRTKGNRAVNAFLKENFLGRLTLFQMEDLRKQFHSLLTDIGFLPKSFRLQDMGHASNNNSKNQGLVKAILCAGLYPNIIVAPRTAVARPGEARKKSDKKVGENPFRSHTKGEVYLHPSTIAFDENQLDSRYCCYHELIRTTKTYVRDCTTVSPFALLLFGGTLDVHQSHGICSVDDWLKFKIDAKPATLIKYLRGKMERMLFQKIVSPEEELIESEEGRALIQSISRLFETEEQQFEDISMTPDRSGGEIVRPWTGIEGENERIRAIQAETRQTSYHRNRRSDERQTLNDGSNYVSRSNEDSRHVKRGDKGRDNRKGGRSGRGRGSRR